MECRAIEGEKIMGMCQGCGEVFSALVMKDGYCQNCKPEYFTESDMGRMENIDNPKNQPVDEEVQQRIQEDKKRLMKKFQILGLIILIGVGIYAYIVLTKPSDKLVKNIAAQYNIGFMGMKPFVQDIHIIKNYEKDGKLHYILQVDKMVCDMPMLKVNSKWIATGINCQR